MGLFGFLFGNKNEKLNDLHQEINKELAEFQDTYDKQTDNSINKEAQLNWQKEVAKQLKALEKFKSKS